VPAESAQIAFLPVSGSEVELVRPTTTDSGLAKYLAKKGAGMHHICLEVDDIKAEIVRLKNHQFQFVDDVPTKGGDGYWVAFLHPKSTNGVLIELCEKMK